MFLIGCSTSESPIRDCFVFIWIVRYAKQWSAFFILNNKKQKYARIFLEFSAKKDILRI